MSRVSQYAKLFKGPLAIGIATGLAISVLTEAVVFFLYSFGFIKFLGCVSSALCFIRLLLSCINCILGDSIGIVERSNRIFEGIRAKFSLQPAYQVKSGRKFREKR
ncbi:MAG TPA: hypothetical protein PLY11_14200 [Syntrophorhabdus sp.]|nr:hypothetical protein [Syntrophorhabdus sp.]